MPHDPHAAVLDMILAAERALRLTAGLSQTEFIGNETVQWAIFSQIVILGEAAGRVERVFQDAHPVVPWADIIGMRHRLVHGYDSVDWVRVWKTIEKDLPPLLQHLRDLVPAQGEKGQ
ncbi:MAG: HepT-like ribonuclease domain-containing protein [Thermodesulfobacteriota bacterium]